MQSSAYGKTESDAQDREDHVFAVNIGRDLAVVKAQDLYSRKLYFSLFALKAAPTAPA